jgi:hypothetical protein
MFKKTMRQGQWETLLIDVDNCDFIGDMTERINLGQENSEGKYPTNVMPPYVQVMWEDGITCPPGEALDDNWFLMEKFFEKDSCKVCPPNEYSSIKSEFCDKVSSSKKYCFKIYLIPPLFLTTTDAPCTNDNLLVAVPRGQGDRISCGGRSRQCRGLQGLFQGQALHPRDGPGPFIRRS